MELQIHVRRARAFLFHSLSLGSASLDADALELRVQCTINGELRSSGSGKRGNAKSKNADGYIWRQDSGVIKWYLTAKELKALKSKAPTLKLYVFGIGDEVHSLGWFFMDLRTPDTALRWIKLVNSKYSGEIHVSSQLRKAPSFPSSIPPPPPQQLDLPVVPPTTTGEDDCLDIGDHPDAIYVLSIVVEGATHMGPMVEALLKRCSPLELHAILAKGFWLSYSIFDVVVQTDVFHSLDVAGFDVIRDSFRLKSSLPALAALFTDMAVLPIFLCTVDRILYEDVSKLKDIPFISFLYLTLQDELPTLPSAVVQFHGHQERIVFDTITHQQQEHGGGVVAHTGRFADGTWPTTLLLEESSAAASSKTAAVLLSVAVDGHHVATADIPTHPISRPRVLSPVGNQTHMAVLWNAQGVAVGEVGYECPTEPSRTDATKLVRGGYSLQLDVVTIKATATAAWPSESDETVVYGCNCAQTLQRERVQFTAEKKAWEIWKRKQQTALDQAEAKRMEALEAEWALREKERLQTVRDAQQEYVALEKKLRQTLHDLDVRERSLTKAEEALQHKLTVQKQEMDIVSRKSKSETQHAMSLVEQQKQSSDLIRQQMEDRAEKQMRLLQLEKDKEVQVQKELGVQVDRLTQLLHQEKRHQDELKVQEVEALRLKYIAREERYSKKNIYPVNISNKLTGRFVLDGDRQELKAIKKQLDVLRQVQFSQNKELARLQKEKAELLATGQYAEDSFVIQELSRLIAAKQP
ncbi:hypothetical protein DYB36_001477 [Aphanomyces astaci]|uniref:DUF3668 domain-containing protein n=1 Tax=Aphanomyces astaci TaxID=112090 RepID=A0A397BW55_APHAT|nr:hypothetical protein DYB36_001477 [Aphanomyces astaci]